MRIRRRIVWGLLVLALLGVAGTAAGFYAAGYRGYVIHTGSMAPELLPGDLIIDRPADGAYRVGDVITFRHSKGPDLVTHRVTQITATGEVHTKGDANRTADVWTIPRNYVEGVVDWRLPGFGYAVVFLQQPTGLASIVVGLIGLILLWQLFFPAEAPATARPRRTGRHAAGTQKVADTSDDDAPEPADDDVDALPADDDQRVLEPLAG
jgi:signal peptidase